jgi:hypothetical protein
MATAFASIVGAAIALLQAGTPVSRQIHRARVRPAAQEWPDMVAVRLLDAQLERFAVKDAPFNVDTTLAVECYARGPAGVSPDLAVDALLEAVYERLAADPSLGGLVQDLEPTGINFDFDADGESIACATLTYLVRHRADNHTLE